jgi:HAE1 family hydrophobic/amphiphilic exporter-1
MIYAKLQDISQRDKDQFAIIQDIRDMFKDVKNLTIMVSENPTMNLGDVSAPFQFLLKSNSLSELEVTSKELIKRLSNVKGMVDVDSTLSNGKPELKVIINRQNAAKYGISANQIANILNTAFSSDRAISKFAQDGKQYDITLRFSDNLRTDIQDIKRMQIKTPTGQIIYLDGLIEFKKSTTNSSISRRDRQRMINVYANLNGIVLGDAVKEAQKIADEIMPDGMTYELYGQAKEMKKVGKSFAFAVGLTLILMYIILAALYESLIQPIIIMITLPLSVTGVMLALYLSGSSFNLFVMIGIMLLLGMVGKNGVLIVDFANQEIQKGKSIQDAIIKAGKKRLRPVLMTTFAMIFAMLPIALSTASGSETKSPMAIAIIGGLISSTLLTLIVIPSFYKLLYPIDKWLRKWYE